MIYAAVLFFGSLIGILTLFGIKYREVRSGRVLAPYTRTAADRGALRLKSWLDMGRVEAQKIPPALLYYARIMLHESALGLASMARTLERQAHRLADFVSHKHRFERKESRSEFLRQMNGHAMRDPRADSEGLEKNENI